MGTEWGSGSGRAHPGIEQALHSLRGRTRPRQFARSHARTLAAHAAAHDAPHRASLHTALPLPRAHLGAQAVLEHEACALSHTNILRLVGKLRGHERHQQRLRAGGPQVGSGRTSGAGGAVALAHQVGGLSLLNLLLGLRSQVLVRRHAVHKQWSDVHGAGFCLHQRSRSAGSRPSVSGTVR